MTETEPQSAGSFDEEANRRAKHFLDEIVTIGKTYYAQETLGDLVIDGPLHPYKFLEKYKSEQLWRKAKGLLMNIYKDYKSSKKDFPNKKWASPLERETFDAESYERLSPVTRTMIEEYIDFLGQSDTDTEPLDLAVNGLIDVRVQSQQPALTERRGRHASMDTESVGIPVDDKQL